MPEALDRPLVAIAGPTGAGKSALAVRVAEVFSGEVVNCDSLQLYRGFDIGTAKIPISQRGGIPHHMLDLLEPQALYSAGEYARDARPVLRDISARGRLPVIAAGTGFYLTALLDGLPPLPPRDPSLRAGLRERESKRPGALHRLLARLDWPAASRIHARDTQKLIRALEVRVLTRQVLPRAAGSQDCAGFRTLRIGLNPDRALLYEILDARAREMFQSGLLEEVERLLASGCTGEEKPFESIGYRQALEYTRGSISREQAIASTQLETRQYAKRQWTWFRRDPRVIWFSGFGHSALTIEQCLDCVRNFAGDRPGRVDMIH